MGSEPAKGSYALRLGVRGKIGLLVLGLVVCGCVVCLSVSRGRITTSTLTVKREENIDMKATLSVQGQSFGQMPKIGANLSSADDDDDEADLVLTAAEAAEEAEKRRLTGCGGVNTACWAP